MELPSLPEMSTYTMVSTVLYAVDMGPSCTAILSRWSSMYKRHLCFVLSLDGSTIWSSLKMLRSAALVAFTLLAIVHGKQVGTLTAETPPSITVQECSASRTCATQGQVHCAQLNLAPGSQYHQLDQLLHRKGVGHSRRQMFIYSMVRARTSYSASRTRSLPLVPTSSCRIFPAV